MTANSASGARTSAERVEVRPLLPVPPHGLGREVAVPEPVRPHPRTARTLSGRSRHTPRAARELVADTCRSWGVPGPSVDDLTLIVSELATNAVMHARCDEITVAVAVDGRDVWVAVVDQGPRTRRGAALRHPDADDENGRGLLLVAALAERYVIRDTEPGTTVMACVRTPLRALPSGRAEDVTTHSPHTPTEDDADVPRSHP